METKKVLEHTCFQKNHPLSPVRCRCRKYISTVQAAKLITEGTAQFIIKGYKNFSIEEVCPLCAGMDGLKTSCSFCYKTGLVTVNKTTPVYGEDIITTVETGIRRSVNTTAKKTPRSPTVESNHILRSVGAIGSGTDAAIERIQEYEMLTLKERIRLLIVNYNLEQFELAWRTWELDTSQEFPLEIRREPTDSLKAHTGRRFDYGRSV